MNFNVEFFSVHTDTSNLLCGHLYLVLKSLHHKIYKIPQSLKPTNKPYNNILETS